MSKIKDAEDTNIVGGEEDLEQRAEKYTQLLNSKMRGFDRDRVLDQLHHVLDGISAELYELSDEDSRSNLEKRALKLANKVDGAVSQALSLLDHHAMLLADKLEEIADELELSIDTPRNTLRTIRKILQRPPLIIGEVTSTGGGVDGDDDARATGASDGFKVSGEQTELAFAGEHDRRTPRRRAAARRGPDGEDIT